MCNNKNNDHNKNQVPSKTDNKRNQKYILGFIFVLFTNFVSKEKMDQIIFGNLYHILVKQNEVKKPITTKDSVKRSIEIPKQKLLYFLSLVCIEPEKKGRDWISRY